MTNLILTTDSYKHSHFLQYPPEARIISAYAEARPGGVAEEASRSEEEGQPEEARREG